MSAAGVSAATTSPRASMTTRSHDFGFREVVRRKENGGAALAALGLEQAPHAIAMLRIQADRRLVEDEQVGPMHRGAGDVGEPAPAARELPRRRAAC